MSARLTDLIAIEIAVSGQIDPKKTAERIVKRLRKLGVLRDKTERTIEIIIQGVELRVEATEQEMAALRFQFSQMPEGPAES